MLGLRREHLHVERLDAPGVTALLPQDYIHGANPDGRPWIEHANATTVHRAQGQTVDHAVAVAAGAKRSQVYVQATRGRLANHVIVAGAGDHSQALAVLRTALDQLPDDVTGIEHSQTLPAFHPAAYVLVGWTCGSSVSLPILRYLVGNPKCDIHSVVTEGYNSPNLCTDTAALANITSRDSEVCETLHGAAVRFMGCTLLARFAPQPTPNPPGYWFGAGRRASVGPQLARACRVSIMTMVAPSVPVRTVYPSRTPAACFDAYIEIC